MDPCCNIRTVRLRGERPNPEEQVRVGIDPRWPKAQSESTRRKPTYIAVDMVPTRRRFLRLTVVGVAGLVADCLGGGGRKRRA